MWHQRSGNRVSSCSSFSNPPSSTRRLTGPLSRDLRITSQNAASTGSYIKPVPRSTQRTFRNKAMTRAIDAFVDPIEEKRWPVFDRLSTRLDLIINFARTGAEPQRSIESFRDQDCRQNPLGGLGTNPFDEADEFERRGTPATQEATGSAIANQCIVRTHLRSISQCIRPGQRTREPAIG